MRWLTMSLRMQQPIAVQVRADGTPKACTWRGVRHPVQVIGCWKLATCWWDAGGMLVGCWSGS
jgi:hypothetical protein